jgi:predicted AAA+ superfamily ATPase
MGDSKYQPRLYDAVLQHHLGNYRQMAFLTGPRQLGKTTACRRLGDVYLNWDNEDHRELILRGPGAVASHSGLDHVSGKLVTVVFDELHKYRRWKLFLKGLFDTYEERVRILFTGSSRLDVYRRGGDSLMGRYFLFRMHPLSVAELVQVQRSSSPLHDPRLLPDRDWQALLEHGGYPEPFVRRELSFSRRWRGLRRSQLLRDEIRDLTRIQEIDQLAILGRLLEKRSGGQMVYSALAREVRVSENTIRSWVSILCSLYYGFLVRPWYRSVVKALRKEPKWFLRDWSGIEDPGQRTETFCACHLLKAVEGWNDLGLGNFKLRYIRDKQQREVDFLVVRDGEPWFLVEAKHGETSLSPSLSLFQRQISCPHAFQVDMHGAYVDENCFSHRQPIVVPALTLFSQLV